jgi:hypothetical protein
MSKLEDKLYRKFKIFKNVFIKIKTISTHCYTKLTLQEYKCYFLIYLLAVDTCNATHSLYSFIKKIHKV